MIIGNSKINQYAKIIASSNNIVQLIFYFQFKEVWTTYHIFLIDLLNNSDNNTNSYQKFMQVILKWQHLTKLFISSYVIIKLNI